jgi:hypothetical protein
LRLACSFCLDAKEPKSKGYEKIWLKIKKCIAVKSFLCQIILKNQKEALLGLAN